MLRAWLMLSLHLQIPFHLLIWEHMRKKGQEGVTQTTMQVLLLLSSLLLSSWSWDLYSSYHFCQGTETSPALLGAQVVQKMGEEKPRRNRILRFHQQAMSKGQQSKLWFLKLEFSHLYSSKDSSRPGKRDAKTSEKSNPIGATKERIWLIGYSGNGQIVLGEIILI